MKINLNNKDNIKLQQLGTREKNKVAGLMLNEFLERKVEKDEARSKALSYTQSQKKLP